MIPTVKTDAEIKTRDEDHARVEDTGWCAKMTGCTHVIVQRQSLRYALKGENDCAVK